MVFTIHQPRSNIIELFEKDPFVDDTVIFAGRVREPKRARKIELDLAISGKSARFGETLRMSIAEAPSDGGRLAAMKKERDKLSKESEDDWVQMVLFSDWSHGYLQMNTLMSEAKTVIEELAEWIDDAFGRHPGDGSGRDTLMAEPGKKRVTGWDSPLTSLQPTDPVPSRRSQSPITSETETEDSGITFVPKKHYCRSRANSFDADRVTSTSNSDAGPAHRVDSSGSDATLLDNHIMTSSSKPPHDHAHDVVNESRHDLRDLRAPLDNGYDMYSRPQTPEAGTGKSSGQRQKGQTITETEMMRRRRLLGSIATFQVRVYLCTGRAPPPFNHHRYSLYATYVLNYMTDIQQPNHTHTPANLNVDLGGRGRLGHVWPRRGDLARAIIYVRSSFLPYIISTFTSHPTNANMIPHSITPPPRTST